MFNLKQWWGKLSPTAVETFDNNSVFGCERKWFFAYRTDLPREENPAAALGDLVHKSIDRYLEGGAKQPGLLHEVARPAQSIMNERHPRLIAHELKLDGRSPLVLEGVPITGRLDTIYRDGNGLEILDWKTTSSIKKWAKSDDEVIAHTQMILYDLWAVKNVDFEPSSLRNTQVFMATKGKEKPETRGGIIQKELLERRTKEVSATVARIRALSAENDVEKFTPDTSKCFKAFGCPYRDFCPRTLGFSNEEIMDDLMSLFTDEKTEAPAEVKPSLAAKFVDNSTPEPQQVLPPDAPASKPELAAKPVDGFKILESGIPNETPKPEEAKVQVANHDTPADAPKKRGRPKKPEQQLINEQEVAAAKATPMPEETAPLRIREIELTHGATVNMGNYQSARVEVKMCGTIEGSATLTQAREALSAAVRKALSAELQTYAKKESVK